MADTFKIPYFDMKLEASQKRLPILVGRADELQRLSRILSRNINHNAFIIGPSGSGKTSILYGLPSTFANHPILQDTHLILFDATALQKISLAPQTALGYFLEVFSHIKNSIILLDNFGELIYNQPLALQNWHLLLKPLLESKTVRLLFSATPKQYDWLKESNSFLITVTESIVLQTQPEIDLIKILKQSAQGLTNKTAAVTISDHLYSSMIQFIERFPILGNMPKAAIELLDECIAETFAIPGFKDNSTMQESTVEKIVSEKTGIPLTKLNHNEKQQLRILEAILNTQIIGQPQALGTIANIIQRARLGLRNPKKPLGSFLLLGPSGVGKTETAKILASELYGTEQSFLRIDMSEFGEAHSVSRLVGSPAGYIGYEEGGQLTNHFKTRPYSLLLLDEIEKAHPKVFDIFLQILDDGRLTSARGETSDFTQGIVMATSNLGVQEILDAYQEGKNVRLEDFLKNNIMPVLLKNFRPEFLNRFDAIVIYKPLMVDDLVSIALLEIQKIEARVKEHNIKFSITAEVLQKKVASLYDPRFGARPIKRFVEEVCENLITKTLLE